MSQMFVVRANAEHKHMFCFEGGSVRMTVVPYTDVHLITQTRILYVVQCLVYNQTKYTLSLS